MHYNGIHIDLSQYITEPCCHLGETRSGFAKSINIRSGPASYAV
jgi:hypothetical protein